MKLKITIVFVSLLALGACSSMFNPNANKKTVSSSLMSFLYPNENSRIEHSADIPILSLPVKVGLAFVPSKNGAQNGINRGSQVELLEHVKQAFLRYDYIDKIEIIPSDYLQGGEGFTTLEQVSRLYDVDVMALVSYDQVTQSLEKKGALLYWTIVGMYLIPANDNSVQTFVDTAVFDVKSQKMLFRAPGINKLSESSTAIKIDAVLAEKSMEGYALAVADMSKNLDTELANFKTRVKEDKVAKVERRDGYSGGSIMWSVVVLVASIMIRRQRS